MNDKIPQLVKEKAQSIVALYGDNIVYKGKYKDKDVYLYCFPKETETGFPFVFLYDDNSAEVTEVTGFEALELLRDLRNNN